MIRRGIATAGYVATVSEGVAKQVRELAIARRRVETIGHGSGLFDDPSSLRVVPLPQRQDRILVVGSEMAHKRKDLAVAAFDLLAEEYADAELVLVGPRADGSKSIDEAIQRSRWKERISREGRVSDDRLRTLLLGSKAMVFPTRREGFGLPVVEAMMAGTPVIVCSDVVGIPAELLGPTIKVQPTADSVASGLRAALEQRSAIERSVFEGRNLARSFTWDAAAAKYIQMYTDLARSAGAE